MPEDADDQQERATENPYKLAEAILGGIIFAYNMDETKTPGGLKARWKIRVVTGPEADRWDQRQAEAIEELLEWASRHPPRHQA